MTYSLSRFRDGAGDSGPMSTLIRVNPDGGGAEYKHNARPEVGWMLQVGALGARTYSYQDYWQTTYITKILESGTKINDSGYEYEYIIFETGNSTYEWRRF